MTNNTATHSSQNTTRQNERMFTCQSVSGQGHQSGDKILVVAPAMIDAGQKASDRRAAEKK